MGTEDRQGPGNNQDPNLEIRLDAVTQIAPDDFYVTAAILAETARPVTGKATE
ncbi:hypothetical protein [Streptosporangium sp. LJ11]|uniref:hypothetical protein n=1 Tax=Streptosporangium sp. LJ11 TaxID=3436927 RepID=UPI003F7A70CF